uniref:Uncharacterized protein n=1 Tax=Daphnia galeata TaxID=27404 RepID=A0A8J2RM99_9CRUS|nr:unnamed protein product [Daphnia galeata]
MLNTQSRVQAVQGVAECRLGGALVENGNAVEVGFGGNTCYDRLLQKRIKNKNVWLFGLSVIFYYVTSF